MPQDTILKEARKSVDALLAQYGEYLLAHQQLEDIRGQKMAAAAKTAKEQKIKLSEIIMHPGDYAGVAALAGKEKEGEIKLQAISDSMFFENPVVWMMYKYFAYRGTPAELSTMRDFRAHCSKPDYICTKRFTFVGTKTDLARFSDDAELPSVYASAALLKLVEHKEFMDAWRAYEFHKDGDRIAKWENFVKA